MQAKLECLNFKRYCKQINFCCGCKKKDSSRFVKFVSRLRMSSRQHWCMGRIVGADRSREFCMALFASDSS